MKQCDVAKDSLSMAQTRKNSCPPCTPTLVVGEDKCTQESRRAGKYGLHLRRNLKHKVEPN